MSAMYAWSGGALGSLCPSGAPLGGTTQLEQATIDWWLVITRMIMLQQSQDALDL